MMFGDDIVRCFFNTPFFDQSFGLQDSRLCPNHGRETSNFLERCSIHPARDVFTEVSRAIDNAFEAATRSMFNDSDMFTRHFGHGYLRDLSHIPPGRRPNGLTSSGETADRLTAGAIMRSARHTNNEPVHMERSRLQWYDSNTRRALVPPPAPTRGQPCGRLTDVELSKLPLSVYRIRPKEPKDSDGDSNGRSVFQPTVESSPIPVADGNNSSVVCSPGSAYLQPVSRTRGLVEIQPLLSSPSRGQPECEVCLTEYREKDQLRHLPCGHAFHSKCIDAWFTQSSTCPKCRAGVRTGLKRLERNHQRTQSVNRNTGDAPVRAIRQRSTTVARAPSGATPQKHPNRRSNSEVIGSSSSGELVEAAEGNELPSIELPSVNSDASSSGERTRRSGSGSQYNITTSSGEHNANNQVTARHRMAVQRSCTTRIYANTRIVNAALTSEDKSAIARRKAGEAAIRRAELARQQRAQSVNDPFANCNVGYNGD